MKTHQETAEIIPYVWQKKEDEPGLSLTILGGVHGDETAGIEVVNQMLLYLIMNRVKKGVLNVGYGNIEAVKAGKRYVEKDLNRCFGKSPIRKNSEEARANMLEKVLMQTDVLLDVHSTIKPSKPFVCIPNLDHPYAKYLPHLGIKTIVTGVGLLPPDGTPIYTDTFVCAKGGTSEGSPQGGFGVTIETGWQGEKDKITMIRKGILQMIQALGLLEEDLTHPLFPDESENNTGEATSGKNLECEYWDAYWNVLAGKQFSFTTELGNFDVVEAGTNFAMSDGKNLSVPEKSIILFPKPPEKIVNGQEACIIARELKK